MITLSKITIEQLNVIKENHNPFRSYQSINNKINNALKNSFFSKDKRLGSISLFNLIEKTYKIFGADQKSKIERIEGNPKKAFEELKNSLET
jgi:hypothetical protein